VNDYYQFLRTEKSDASRLKKISKKIYEQLFAPAIILIDKRLPVTIVPDGILHYLPFETLWTGDSFLVEKIQIGYIASAGFYNQLKRNQRKNTSAAPISVFIFKSDYQDIGSDIHGQFFESLPYIENEKNEVVKYFRDDIIQTHNNGIDETRFKNLSRNEFTVLHIAAHGINNPVFPEHSALVVGKYQDASNDGYLTADEISKLPFKSRLVVLSACETSLGELLWGEGMIGLTRAFFQSGSSAVLSTLWKIRDSATAQLMDRFYYYLKKENESPTRSLQKAKIDLIQGDYHHPFFWGAFVLWGR
jgi:CHAT domain-containing protein